MRRCFVSFRSSDTHTQSEFPSLLASIQNPHPTWTLSATALFFQGGDGDGVLDSPKTPLCVNQEVLNGDVGWSSLEGMRGGRNPHPSVGLAFQSVRNLNGLREDDRQCLCSGRLAAHTAVVRRRSLSKNSSLPSSQVLLHLLGCVFLFHVAFKK